MADDAAAAYLDSHRWASAVLTTTPRDDVGAAPAPPAGTGPDVTISTPVPDQPVVLGGEALPEVDAGTTAVPSGLPVPQPPVPVPPVPPPAGPQAAGPQPAGPLPAVPLQPAPRVAQPTPAVAPAGPPPQVPAPAEPAPLRRPAPAEGSFTPARLVVPSLGVDGPVADVGLTARSEFAVPDDPGLVGRWDGGARPGDGRGTVALAGHVTWRGTEGLLHDLAELRPGAEVWLLAADGTGAVYVAGSVDVHTKATAPWRDVFRADVAERLVLITCGGRVDPVTGVHDSNVVAYLTPAPV